MKNLLDHRAVVPESKAFESQLRRMLVGQDLAVDNYLRVFERRLGRLPRKGFPDHSELLLGPTGTGKTRYVESIAFALHGSPSKMVKIDCGEFQSSHEVSKLVGSPPGYLGHRETPALLNEDVLKAARTENCKIAVVLFDEIEKAHPALHRLLLATLDKAIFHTGQNQAVNFEDAQIFMTSNLGSESMRSILSKSVGFEKPKLEAQLDGTQKGMAEKLQKSAIDAFRKHFSPEFLNRIDQVSFFNPFSTDQLDQVLRIELRLFQEAILADRISSDFVFYTTKQLRAKLVEKGFSVEYGARPLKRVIKKYVINPLSVLRATDQMPNRCVIRIDWNEAKQDSMFLVDAILSHDESIDKWGQMLHEINKKPVEPRRVKKMAAA